MLAISQRIQHVVPHTAHVLLGPGQEVGHAEGRGEREREIEMEMRGSDGKSLLKPQRSKWSV